MTDVTPYVPDPEKYVRTSLGEYAIGELRALAYEWHGGQWSPLYAFASSGTVVDGLASEANKCAGLADESDESQFDESDKLRAIASLEE